MSARIVIACAVALAVLGSCTAASKGAAPTGRAPLPSATTTTTVAGPADLRSVIFDQFPSRYIEEPAGYDLEGPLDLAGAAKAVASNPSAEQPVLQQYGFQRGYERAWVVKGSSEGLDVWVLLMGSPAQALAYLAVRAFDDNIASDTTAFPTPGIANSDGFTQLFTDSRGPRMGQFVDLVAGPLFYQLALSGPRGSIASNSVLSIARSQVAEAASLAYP